MKCSKAGIGVVYSTNGSIGERLRTLEIANSLLLKQDGIAPMPMDAAAPGPGGAPMNMPGAMPGAAQKPPVAAMIDSIREKNTSFSVDIGAIKVALSQGDALGFDPSMALAMNPDLAELEALYDICAAKIAAIAQKHSQRINNELPAAPGAELPGGPGMNAEFGMDAGGGIQMPPASAGLGAPVGM
jgi:hypothetical protein